MKPLVLTRPKIEVIILVLSIFGLIFVSESLSSSDVLVLIAGVAATFRVGWLLKTKQLLLEDFLSFSNAKRAITYYGLFTLLGIVGLWLMQDSLLLPEWLVSDNVLWFMPIHI